MEYRKRERNVATVNRLHGYEKKKILLCNALLSVLYRKSGSYSSRRQLIMKIVQFFIVHKPLLIAHFYKSLKITMILAISVSYLYVRSNVDYSNVKKMLIATAYSRLMISSKNQ